MVKEKISVEEEKYVTICPKCKSPDVDTDKSNSLQPALGLPDMYICNKCGHSGYAFPEVSMSEFSNFQKEAKAEGLIDSSADKTPKIDPNYGNFAVRVWWKVSAPIALIIGISLLFLGGLKAVIGILLIIGSLIAFYITYFKKRKLKDD